MNTYGCGAEYEGEYQPSNRAIKRLPTLFIYTNSCPMKVTPQGLFESGGSGGSCGGEWNVEMDRGWRSRGWWDEMSGRRKVYLGTIGKK